MPYRPHLSLLRHIARPLPQQALPPLVMPLREVSLFASVLRPGGAHHYRLDGWPVPASVTRASTAGD